MTDEELTETALAVAALIEECHPGQVIAEIKTTYMVLTPLDMAQGLFGSEVIELEAKADIGPLAEWGDQ